MFLLQLLSSGAFDAAFKPIMDLLDQLLVPILALVGSLGAIWCIVLGVKFAKAEEPQEREKAKGALKNAIIGFVLIFVLIATLKLAMPALKTWMTNMINNG